MARFLLAALAPLGALGASGGASLQAQVTPIQKVVQLLNDMTAKGKNEKHEEEVEFAKFQEWCDGTRESTTKNINEAADQIQQLDADIAKAEADAEELGVEINQLDGEIGQAEKELSQASAVREKERGDYMAGHADLSESVDAIERAIAVLKSRAADVPQSLLQLKANPRIPAEAKTAIEAFLAVGASSQGSEFGAPEANAYEFQSGGVVALLEKLRHKFQDQRLVLEKEEMNSRSNFELLEQKLTDNIKEDKKRAGDKSGAKSQKLEDAAGAKGDLSETETGKAQDEKKLSDTLAECHAKSEEFEKNQVTRAEEVKAIEKAVQILLSDDVTGHADKYLPAAAAASFTQTGRRGSALVQLRGGETPEETARRQHLVEFLQGKAKLTGSRYLSLAASHVSAGDPFGKVKQMIKDLIVKLMEQANSEADHKAYCDAELATNKQTRENKQAEVDSLTANIEKHESQSAELAQELAELSDAISELRRQQAEATALRKQEKATNAQTIADAKSAQSAVELATKVLKEFYGKAADSSLLQGLSQEMKSASQAPYKGMQTESGGIFGFLEVILSDFARLEAETSTAEDSQASAYEKFMDESNEDIAVKETASGHKVEKKEQVDQVTASLKKELELTQSELDAALSYYEKLKPDCVDHGLSYGNRKQLREEEIQSLKEALDILNQQDLA